jgi:signal transduction histidine kinase
MLSKEAVGLREDRLLTMLERLLELPTNDVNSTLNQATQLVADVLAAEKVEAFLENLLANAVKYAPKYTFITVQVSGERRVDGPWMLLTVSNEGPGIPPEQCAQLLRPFVAGVTSTGLGLGLYLANRIAEAHYGTLMVDSPAGRGVRVTLALPMEDEDWSEFNHEEYGLSETIVFRA